MIRFAFLRSALRRSLFPALPALLATFATFTTRAHAAGDWLKIHQDATNNAARPELADPIDVAGPAAWDTGAHSLAARCGVAVTGGLAYTMIHNGQDTFSDTTDDTVTLVVYNAANGQLVWQSASLDLGQTIGFDSNSSPTVDPIEGAVYVPSGQTVYKFSIATHAELWHTRLDATNTSPTVTSYDIINSSPVVAHGKVFIETYGGFASANKQIVALDSSNGHGVWFHNDKGAGASTPVFVDDPTTPRLFTSDLNGIRCYNPDTGALLWNHATLAVPWSLAYASYASIVYNAGRLFIVTNSFGSTGELVCADAATGARLWHVDDIPACSVAPLVLGDKVYVQGGGFGDPARVAAYHTTDGSPIFNVAVGGVSYNTDFAATADRIYMTNESDLLAIDPTSGTIVRSAVGSFPDTYDGPITIDAAGTMYVHRNEGLIAIAAPATPPPLWPIAPFRPAQSFTDNDLPAARRNMSRIQHDNLQWGPDHKLHLVYWEGVEFTDPVSPVPDRVWFRSWDDTHGWDARERADHGGVSSVGGRHPSLALDGQSQWTVAWHDFRNTTQANNYLDNIEIYDNTRPLDSTFGTTDTRLTQSNSGSAGDNGYTPRVVALHDGRLAVVWYDFFWNVNQSEIAVRVSDPAGNFGSPAMTTITADTRGYRESGDANASFTLPSVAVDSSDTLHLVWGTDISRNSSKLYYGRLNPTTGQWIERRRLLAGVGGFFDPAKVISDPRTGDIWIVYTNHNAGNDDLWAMRRKAGAADFDAPAQLTSDTANQFYPDAQVDGSGQLHVVYVDESAPGSRVRYLVYNPATSQVTRNVDLSTALAPNPTYPDWARPALAHDDAGYLYCVWEKMVSDTAGELFFTTDLPRNAAQGWELYR